MVCMRRVWVIAIITGLKMVMTAEILRESSLLICRCKMKNMRLKITGKLPSPEHLKLLKQSPHYRDKSFQNLSDTPMISEDASYWKMTKDYFKGNKMAHRQSHCRISPPTLIDCMKLRQ